jgi:hypothetical protein
VVELKEPVALLAGDLAGRFPLRGGDAVQLASALIAAEDDTYFVSWDGVLREAAAGVGLPLAPA